MLEDYAVVLDYLPRGRADEIRPREMVQLLGTKNFTLLEAVPRKEADIKIGDIAYVGKEKRDKVERIVGRINYEDLTGVAKTELNASILKIIKEREKEFVEFFNKCGAINIRQHQLELLPGIGKKHAEDILREREKKHFESFEEISTRVELLPNPTKLVADRIEAEIKGVDKYFIFVRPPRREEEFTYQRRYRR